MDYGIRLLLHQFNGHFQLGHKFVGVSGDGKPSDSRGTHSIREKAWACKNSDEELSNPCAGQGNVVVNAGVLTLVN